MSVAPTERGSGVGPLSQSPQSRWLVVEQPPALPGSCFMCSGSYAPGAPVGRVWFVDTGQQFEFHGAVYICNLCLEEMAKTAGWVTPAEALALFDEVKDLKAKNYQLMLQVAALNGLEQAANDVLRSRSGGPVQSLDDRPHGIYLLQGEGTPPDADGHREGDPSGATDQLGAGARASDEPRDGQGMDDLRSDDAGDVPGGGTFTPGNV